MKPSQSPELTLSFLDHVALRVADVERAAAWYGQVLGLKRYQLPEWGPVPIFMLAGKSGVALFPARLEEPESDPGSRNVKIDHFAFQVDRENYEKAKKRYTELGLEFSEQDHHYFHSIYTQDPDGHTVELTTLVVAAEDFYAKSG